MHNAHVQRTDGMAVSAISYPRNRGDKYILCTYLFN